MDILIVFIGFIVLFVGAVVGSFAASLLIQGIGFNQLNNKIQRVENKIASTLGNQAKVEQSEELQQVMLEAAQILKDDSIPKEEKTKHLINIALQHPAVSMQLIKKFGLKGLM